MAENPTNLPAAAIVLGQLTEITKWQTAATIASAIISTSGRHHSIQEALDIARDVHFAMFPVPNEPDYQEWAKTKHTRINKKHGPA